MLAVLAVPQEIDELCEEWEPEPLFPAVTPEQAAWQEPVISSQTGTQVGAGGWVVGWVGSQ